MAAITEMAGLAQSVVELPSPPPLFSSPLREEKRGGWKDKWKREQTRKAEAKNMRYKITHYVKEN